MCNAFSKIARFISQNNTDQALKHLDKQIARTDGCALRNAVDPKGQSQAQVADFIIVCSDQQALYSVLIAARNAIGQ